MLTDPNCETVESSAIVQRQEKGKRFRINNSRRFDIRVVSVDGCLLKSQGKKCDYLFVVESTPVASAFLVELKGTDHVHAVRQIIDTAEAIKLGEFIGEKRSYIVGAPAPKIATKFQNEIRKQKKRFDSLGLSYPERKNNVLEITI